MGTKKKILGLVLILALACFSFLGLKNIISSKADESDVSARLIYANALDEEGNSTDATEYSFEKGEGYSPYAVYVSSKVASGSAITLNKDSFNHELDDAEFTNIRIWDNNCGVTVETDLGYVDPRLILVGDDSYLDVGWSHFNRGGCDADKYTGVDDAAAIAEYFNSFVLDDENPENINYYNDEDVFMGYDAENIETNPEDPHYGKTVYYITWYMSVSNLTLDDNVVAFIQSSVEIDEESGDEFSTYGMLSVKNSITVGEGSYIESCDDYCRLDIQNDDARITGMSLYDFSENEDLTTLTSEFSGGYCYIDQEIDGNTTRVWTRFHEYNIGNPEVTTAAKKFIYAYANLDFDGDGNADGNDLRFALATELLIKFRNMYGMFGLYGDYGGAPEEVWYGVYDDALIFSERIDIDFNNPETITAKDADGNVEKITRFKATISWGNTEELEEIKSDVYVYQLNFPEELLICTDFDETTGDGNTFFVRKSFDDKKVLVGDVTAPLEDVDEDLFASVIVTDKIGKVAAGGHAVSLYEKNTSENLYTFQTISYHTMKEYRDNKWEDLRFDTFVKIFTPNGKYFATATEGETKRYDFVSNANGKAADDIWEADSSAPVKLFIHDNILHIKPLNVESGLRTQLKTIRLVNTALSKAVLIDDSNPEDIVITFKSDFYDTVNFEIVYENDKTSTFTVEREGIIIQYTGLDTSITKGRYWLDIYGEGEGNELNYKYDPATENFVVMASYYHSSAQTGIDDLSLIITYDDDNSTEVISSIDTKHNFSGYISGESHKDDNGVSAVDTTTFIIGFMNAEGPEFTFSKNGHTGGFSVQVVNSGYNDANNFGGALLGSGKGKHWDGKVNYLE